MTARTLRAETASLHLDEAVEWTRQLDDVTLMRAAAVCGRRASDRKSSLRRQSGDHQAERCVRRIKNT